MGEALPEIHTKKYLIICALGRKKKYVPYEDNTEVDRLHTEEVRDQVSDGMCRRSVRVSWCVAHRSGEGSGTRGCMWSRSGEASLMRICLS